MLNSRYSIESIHSHNYRQRLTRSTDSKRSEVCLTNQEPTNQPTNHRRSSDFAAGGIKDKEREREERALLLLLVVVRQVRAALACFGSKNPEPLVVRPPPNVGRKELAHARAWAGDPVTIDQILCCGHSQNFHITCLTTKPRRATHFGLIIKARSEHQRGTANKFKFVCVCGKPTHYHRKRGPCPGMAGF